jgi:hypothetical protein
MTREQRITRQKAYILKTADRTDITLKRKAEILESALVILERLYLEDHDGPWYDTPEETEFKEWYQEQINSPNP